MHITFRQKENRPRHMNYKYIFFLGLVYSLIVPPQLSLVKDQSVCAELCGAAAEK
jgi:hypothetical protein